MRNPRQTATHPGHFRGWRVATGLVLALLACPGLTSLLSAPALGRPLGSDPMAPMPLLRTITNTTVASPSSLNGYVPDDQYKLRVGDKVSLQILEDRDAPRSLVVADSGELDVPYIGRIQAKEKTSKQLAEELKTQLEKEYYYRATVILALDVANKLLGHVYVMGQVKTQGPIELNVGESLTVGKAILRAGGFGDFANQKRVRLIRAANGTNAKQVVELNMVDILKEGKTEKDVLLQDNDTIYVEPKYINF